MGSGLSSKFKGLSLPNILRQMGIFPFFRVLESSEATHAGYMNKNLIMMGSNNYLGLTHHPEVVEASIQAIKKWGTGCTGSRFLNGNLSLHTKLEKQLADFFGYEDSLVFSTGYMANEGAISSVVGTSDFIFSDKDNHASIVEGNQLSGAKMLRYRHLDMADLEAKLNTVPREAGQLIITDGVFSMSGAIAPYDQIHALAKKYNAHTYVDEAHGVGVLGPGGRGAAAQYGLKPDYLMGTFSKSLASQGGFVCGSKEAIDWMRLKARTMMFSAALAPASVAAAEKSLEILIESPQMVNDLKMKSDYFRERMKAKGLNVIDSQTSIVSVLIGDDTEALAMSKKLENDGVFATPVLSPAVPRGRTLIRCSVIATHKFSDLDAVAEIFAKNIQSLKSKDKPSTASLHAMMDDGLTPEQVHSYLGAQL